MNKLSILTSAVVLSLGTSVTGYSKTVDENTAKKTGSNFLVSNGIPGVQSAGDLEKTYTATAQVNGKTVVDYYVFNFTNGNGFVMVSGDDKVIPILAYSAESVFDINHMAPSTKDWIEGYQNQITYVLQNDLPASDDAVSRWEDLKTVKPVAAARTTSVFPSSTVHLIATKWDQAPGYNNYCPNGTGGRAVVGCVATAMAQVMKFWSWPAVGTGSHTYTQPTNPLGYVAQTANFGNKAYNWSAMAATTSGPAVDTLMYHCGVSVDMDYSPSESGSYVITGETPAPTLNCAEYALKTYFHYKRSLHGVLRGGIPFEGYTLYHVTALPGYTTAAWISLLKAELDASRPMLYKGYGSTGGHCWVCDGYNSTSMMHFNFGWSGASDGYYTVDAIAPPALGTGGGGSGNNFNLGQGVILGIVPDSFLTATSAIKLAAHLSCANNSPIAYNSGFSYVTTITNGSTAAFTGSFAAQVFDTANVYVGTIQTLTGQALAAGATSSPLTFTTTGMMGMIPSIYNVRIMYQKTGTTAWVPVGDNGTNINNNVIDVRNIGIATGIELGAKLDVTTGTSLAVNGALTANTLVRNLSSSDFDGTIQCVLINIATGATFTVQQFTGENIAHNSPNAYTFTNAHVTAAGGNYVLAVRYQPNGTGPFSIVGSDYYVNPVLIRIHTGVGITTPAADENISVYPNPAKDVVYVDGQGTAFDNIAIVDMQGREIRTISNTAGQQTMTVPVSDLASGIYVIQLRAAGGVVNKKIVIAK